MYIIEENLDLSWDQTCIAKNPNLTINFIRKYKEILNLNWCWPGISYNENIQMEDIENNLDLAWEF